MGILANLIGGCIGQRLANNLRVDGETEVRKLLVSASEFMKEAKQRYVGLLATMEQDKLFAKAKVILKADMMLYTWNEILHYLNDAVDTYKTMDGRTRIEMKEHIDILRKVITRGFFYIHLLKDNVGNNGMKISRLLNQKGLLDKNEKEYTLKIRRYIEEISELRLSDQEIYRLMVLREMAKSQTTKDKTKKPANVSRKPQISKSSLLSFFSPTKPSADFRMSHDLLTVTGHKSISQIRPLPEVTDSSREEFFQESIQAVHTEPRPVRKATNIFRRGWTAFTRRVVIIVKRHANGRCSRERW